MALDDLQAVIESLQDKIKEHYADLSSSETRTRQVLIDPLLKELGWDVSDPSQVELEYSAGTGGEKADYALIANGKPVIIVEAKSLKTQLGDRVVMQALNYANSRGIAYMVVTNGDEWRMYDVFAQKAAIEERVLVQFSLSRAPVHGDVLESLVSWHSKLMANESISPVRVPEPTPVISTRSAGSVRSSRRSEGVSVSQPQSDVARQPDAKDGWIPLAEVILVPKGPIPKSVRFEDGTEVGLKYRKYLLIEVANWLATRTVREKWLNFSTGDKKPVKTSKSPTPLKNGLYFHNIESYSNASNTLRVSKDLLDYFGYGESDVYVKF